MARKRSNRGLSRPAYIPADVWAKAGPRKRVALLKESARISRERKAKKSHGLRENFLRLANNMISNGVPQEAAFKKSKQMQDLQDWYLPKSATHNPKVLLKDLKAKKHGEKIHRSDWETFQDKYDEWYDELEQSYGYDINELYPREANE